jgi:hypothetical protein
MLLQPGICRAPHCRLLLAALLMLHRFACCSTAVGCCTRAVWHCSTPLPTLPREAAPKLLAMGFKTFHVMSRKGNWQTFRYRCSSW